MSAWDNEPEMTAVLNIPSKTHIQVGETIMIQIEHLHSACRRVS